MTDDFVKSLQGRTFFSNFDKLTNSLVDISKNLKVLTTEVIKSNKLKEKEIQINEKILELELDKLMDKDLTDLKEEKFPITEQN
jgi:hypothetical protein